MLYCWITVPTDSEWPDFGTTQDEIWLGPVKADIKEECEKLPSAGLEGEIRKYADKILLKEGVTPDKICT
ncbi:hypothetical protein GCK32_004704 [Trichostrongylus colubriformis]|uniref:Uncharacterized protein n=1 Tax=Trichostrongylus colubriformis TaxID=6319 RepID=A0AAN8F4B4_TRICO